MEHPGLRGGRGHRYEYRWRGAEPGAGAGVRGPDGDRRATRAAALDRRAAAGRARTVACHHGGGGLPRDGFSAEHGAAGHPQPVRRLSRRHDHARGARLPAQDRHAPGKLQFGAAAAAVLHLYRPAHPDRAHRRSFGLAAVPADHRGGDRGQAGRERGGGAPLGHALARVAAAGRADEHARADGTDRAEHWLRLGHPAGAHLHHAGDHGAGDHHADWTAAYAVRGPLREQELGRRGCLNFLSARVAVVIALALGADGLKPAVVEAQIEAGKTSAHLMTLTPLDYVEIKQLAARYAHAVDQGANDGYAYADLFAPGGTFGKTTGRDDLAKLAKQTSRGPQTTWHFIVNHVIEPTEGGAKGREYMVHLRYGEPGQPNAVW